MYTRIAFSGSLRKNTNSTPVQPPLEISDFVLCARRTPRPAKIPQLLEISDLGFRTLPPHATGTPESFVAPVSDDL
jgi:hypothetical protein